VLPTPQALITDVPSVFDIIENIFLLLGFTYPRWLGSRLVSDTTKYLDFKELTKLFSILPIHRSH